MLKKTWWIAWLLATAVLLLSVTSVFAATAITNTGFKIWPAKTTAEVNKVWTISFNAPLLSTSVNSDTVYVTDSKQTKVATTIKLSPDGLSVTVTPSKAYTGGDYNLYITNGVKSWANLPLNEMIIVPFSVTVSNSYTSSVSLVVTVTDDFKTVSANDLSGFLTLEGKSGNRLGPSKDLVTGKYTFMIFADDDYSLNYFSLSDGIITYQSVKIPTIKLPIIKLPIIGTITPTVKTASLVIATQAGVDSKKSGSIGGSTNKSGTTWGSQKTFATWSVPVIISNTTSTWTTRTDIYGDFKVLLPAGSYTLVVDGNGDQYKKHTYKLTVTAGQMATPSEIINVEDPID